MRKVFGRFIFITVVVLIAMFCKQNVVKATSESMNLDKLDFEVNINSDGSMAVTETWEISVENVNTLYKTFEVDESKYSSISNVKVIEKKSSREREFTQTDEETDEVTENSFYALTNSDGEFVIAWGIGMEGSSGTKTYEISYTVNDVIAKYNDYAELYWQFINEDFSINADQITGTITLPDRVEDLDEIRVWSHTDEVDGDVYVAGENKITFTVNNYEAGNMLEIRSLFPTSLISSTSRTYDANIYDDAIAEEAKLLTKENLQEQWNEIKGTVLKVFIFYVMVALCIIYIVKAVKYLKKLRTIESYKPSQKLDYFKSIPQESTTPGEAVFVLHEAYSTFSNYFGKIFSADILDLALKGYIELKIESKSEQQEKAYITLKAKKPKGKLLKEERAVMLFIEKAIGDKNKIEIKELEKYIKENPRKVQKLIFRSRISIERALEKEHIIEKNKKEEYAQYSEKVSVYWFACAFTLIFGLFPISIVFLINAIICGKIAKKSKKLTKQGVDIQEKWKGLKRYMKNFATLDEKEVPAIEKWEEYLVYATAFGIADKVVYQLKTIYPDIEKKKKGAKLTYMPYMYNDYFFSVINHSMNRAIKIANSSSEQNPLPSTSKEER